MALGEVYKYLVTASNYLLQNLQQHQVVITDVVSSEASGDWCVKLPTAASQLPAGVVVDETKVDPTTYVIDQPQSTALQVEGIALCMSGGVINPGDHVAIAAFTRTDSTAGGTTLGSTTVTDASAVAADAGMNIAGTGIPVGATIITASVGVGYVISVPATATGSSITLTVTSSFGSVATVSQTGGGTAPKPIVGQAISGCTQAGYAVFVLLSLGSPW
jgi:hypothetical protein